MFGKNRELEKNADYRKLIKEFGAQPLNENIINKLKKKHKLIELGFIFAHRDFDKYLKETAKGKNVAIVSGRGPSNQIHLGHLCLFDFISYLQRELNAEVYIPLSDDEKYVFQKVDSLETAYKYALDNALDIISCGYKKEKTHLYISTKTKWVFPLSIKLSRYLTYSTVKAVFGFSDDINPGAVFYGPIQAAHILGPTIQNGFPVIVPIGMDQDPHMRLARDIAGKLGIFKPASLYLRYLRGLTGEPMSASKPETSIFLTDDTKTVKKKIWEAYTGGRATIKEQRELGGKPEKCIVYEWLTVFHFKNKKENMEHAQKCRAGELTCGQCKELLTKTIIKMLREHKKKREKYKEEIKEYFTHKI